ncbi:MAG: hypothetical protein NT062_37190, partial [Proteobacteria bacterium]|nr:hypothetical protein [Pseudomonadota bacterium]
ADAPLVVPLTLTLTTPDATLVATKVVALGVHADNPPAPQILRDGTRQAIALTVGVEAGLIVEGALPDHAYRWFSSVGDLVGYTRAEATVTPAIATTGWIVVVDRDATGGTAWTIAPATVGDVR